MTNNPDKLTQAIQNTSNGQSKPPKKVDVPLRYFIASMVAYLAVAFGLAIGQYIHDRGWQYIASIFTCFAAMITVTLILPPIRPEDHWNYEGDSKEPNDSSPSLANQNSGDIQSDSTGSDIGTTVSIPATSILEVPAVVRASDSSEAEDWRKPLVEFQKAYTEALAMPHWKLAKRYVFARMDCTKDEIRGEW